MDNVQILAIGRNQAIMDVVLRLINQHPRWVGDLAPSVEAALTLLRMEKYAVVLLCGGISEEEESALRSAAAALSVPPRIVRHYGGGSGLLENEILQALQ